MNKYELLFIISADTSDEAKDSIIEKLKVAIEAKSGVVEGVDKWGMKKLAYPIKFKNEGYYVLVNFSTKAENISELDRILFLNEKVVRYMFVNKD